MRKMIIIILLAFFVLSVGSTGVFAEKQGLANGQEKGSIYLNQPVMGDDPLIENDPLMGVDSPMGNNPLIEDDPMQQIQQNTQNNGDEQLITIQQREQVRASNPVELGQMIQQKQQEMNQELQGLGTGSQNIYQNQNQVRLAVHSLFAMEDLVGGFGPQIRKLARDFNNSVKVTIRAEEKTQERTGFMRFFFGGDEIAAGELEQEVNVNRQRIQTLEQLREDCDCDSQVKTMLQEQIQNIEQEQNRLQQLAQAEKQNKGLFGWLWK